MADYSFPFGQTLELLLACFKGTIFARINSLQQKLQRTDVAPQLYNNRQVQKLNNLESQAWLYGGILERLGEDSSVNHERIARTLEALEYKRSEILQELEPRRPRNYRVLAGIQDSARLLLASQAEKDYEQLQKIVANLVLFTRGRQPSQIILSEVINKLAAEITQNTNQISPCRLRLACRIDELMRILSTKLVLGSDGSRTDSDYQLLVNELRSRINLLSKDFDNLLRAKQEDAGELDRYRREISSLTKNISDLHRDVSNRDADTAALRNNIKDLTELTQEKQARINSLQHSISDLQRDVQSSTEVDQRKQSQINHLQNQLSQLNQQKLNLQKRIQDIANYTQSKDSEIAGLLSERSQLISRKSDLQRQYQNLSQHYQQQQNEIIGLKEKIKNLSQLNRQTAQQPVQETRSSITPEEYQRIVNKSDYVYVKAYYKNGSPVKAHYRRRPNR